MTLKRKLLELLARAGQIERDFVAALTDEQRAVTGTSERWSAKDVVVHIALWKQRRAKSFAAVQRGEPLATFEVYDRINAEDFEKYKHLAWEQTLACSQRSHNLLVETANRFEDDELGRDPARPEGQGERPLWARLLGVGFTHPVIHIATYLVENGQVELAVQLQEEATRLLEELDDAPIWKGNARYNLACIYAQAGQAQAAIQELGQALALNPGLVEWSQQDPDLESLRGRPEF